MEVDLGCNNKLLEKSFQKSRCLEYTMDEAKNFQKSVCKKSKDDQNTAWNFRLEEVADECLKDSDTYPTEMADVSILVTQ